MSKVTTRMVVAAREALEGVAQLSHGEALKAIEAAISVTDEWKPIKDAPENEMLLLACDTWVPSKLRGETAPVKVGGFWDGAWHVFGASWQPTHWMVLPVKEMAA